jgi:hypothetical protein
MRNNIHMGRKSKKWLNVENIWFVPRINMELWDLHMVQRVTDWDEKTST